MTAGSCSCEWPVLSDDRQSAGVLGSPGAHTVHKGEFVPLSAPVKRVFYLSTDAGEAQHEVIPR